MNKKIQLLLLVILSVNLSITQGQQLPIFIQTNTAVNYLNPAITGSAGRSRIQTNYRNQWQKFNGGFETYYAGFELVNDNLPVNVGVYALYDNVGDGFDQSYLAGLSISRAFRLIDSLYLSAGLSVNYLGKAFGETVLQFNPPIVYPPSYGSGIPLNGGLALSNRIFMLSYSMLNFNQPRIKFDTPLTLQFVRQHIVQTAVRVPIFGLQDLRGPFATIRYVRAGTRFLQLTAGYRFKHFRIGAGSLSSKVFTGFLGYLGKNLQLTYNYEYRNLQFPNEKFGGTHEVSLQLCLGNSSTKRPGIKWFNTVF